MKLNGAIGETVKGSAMILLGIACGIYGHEIACSVLIIFGILELI